MKVVFISNVLNNHMVEFCDELYQLNNQNFTFIETEENLNSTSKGEGLDQYCDKRYLIKSKNYTYKQIVNICSNADVLIQGQAPIKYVLPYLKSGKTLYKISEHYFKGGWKDRVRKVKYTHMFYLLRKYDISFLASSSQLFNDLQRLNVKNKKVFKWGYFPNTYSFEKKETIKGSNVLSFIWVGRMIDWKHPEMILKLCSILDVLGKDYLVNVIGEGPRLQGIKEAIIKKNLSSKVLFHGSLSNKETQRLMFDSDFIFTSSDNGEGWGAVLNEGMAQGCIPIASNEAGSSKFLISNYDNGFLYSIHDDSLTKIIEYVVNVNQSKLENMKKNAQETINDVWNGKIAADRLMNYVCNSSSFLKGPMERITNEER